MLNNIEQYTILVGVPLLDQPAVQKKLHTDLATLEVPQPCTTCQEALHGIPVPQSQECKPRCSHDKYHPKIYYNIISYHVCCLKVIHACSSYWTDANSFV